MRFRALSGAELAKAEPVLRDDLPGAIHWLDTWTVSDPGALVTAYAELFERLGGTIVLGDAQTLQQTATGWSVETDQGRIDAAPAVVTLGPWSPDLLLKFGYRIPLVRKRGYHMHYSGGASLDLPLVDKAGGYAMGPMAKGIRITTGAELTGMDALATPVQLASAEASARELIDLGKRVEPDPWFGTRPCTPDMLPVLGPAPRHPGLWMNFGHGHQGFTLGPATGRLLAEMMSGETPAIDPTPYRPERCRLQPPRVLDARAGNSSPARSASSCPDAVGVFGRRRIVDDHAEIGAAVDIEARIFERHRAVNGMPQPLGAVAMMAHVVVAPERREFRTGPAAARRRNRRHARRRRLARRRPECAPPRSVPRCPSRIARRARADRRR